MTEDVSVSPYPFEGCPTGHASRMRRTRSGGAGAPPYETPRIDDVSNFEKLGESSTCITMEGTPPNVPILSRSISSSARSGSKWCIITSLPPAATFETMTEWHPVAWKSGTERRKAGCALSPTGSRAGVPNRMDPRVLMKNRLIKLVHMLRCVPTAPLGRPVVPDV